MPQISAITLNDAQVSPVAHVFAPAQTSADMALLEDRSLGYYAGFGKLKFKLSRPKPARKGVPRSTNIRLVIGVETPKLENTTNSTITGIAPAPTVSHRPTVEMAFVFPERCSLADRKDLLKYMLQLASNSFVTAAVENLELPW